MKMTDLRKRALQMLDQRGEMEGQFFTATLVPRQYHWTPQGATRWAGGYMAPLIKAGYVTWRRGNGCFGNYYSITEAGRAAVRE